MIYTMDGQLRLQDVPQPLLDSLTRQLTVPNPRYEQAVRMGRPVYGIPRKILLYEVRSNELVLPRGMAEQVWRQRPAGTVARDRTIHTLHCDFPACTVALRDYQQEAVQAALHCRFHQGILVAPCGAGKTEMGLALIAALQAPALWIAHTLDLAEQALERARLRLGLTGGEAGLIDAKHKTPGTKLTVATVQSLYHMDMDELGQRFGTVIVDECHHVVNNPEQASMFAAVLAMLPARYRFGLTASDDRSDGLRDTIFQVLGGRIAAIDPARLEQHTIRPSVLAIRTDFVYSPVPGEQPIDHARLLRHMTADAGRTQCIIAAAIDRAAADGTSWLVLGGTLELLERLYRYAQQLGLAAEYICGATKKAERRAALQRMRDGESRILFATYQLAKEGLDIPRLDRLVLATPTRNKVIVQQSIGRIQRQAPGKTSALILDFVDARTPQLKAQYRQRRALYRNMQIDIQEDLL